MQVVSWAATWDVTADVAQISKRTYASSHTKRVWIHLSSGEDQITGAFEERWSR